MIYYVLTLYFACGAGCGEPGHVTLPEHYASVQACHTAGQVWTDKKANPDNAIFIFACNGYRLLQ